MGKKGRRDHPFLEGRILKIRIKGSRENEMLSGRRKRGREKQRFDGRGRGKSRKTGGGGERET